MATADFNGDGRSDVVTANAGSSNVSVLLEQLQRHACSRRRHIATGIDPRSVAVGDVNNDGKLDIVTANGGGYASGGNLSVLLGNGNGTFQPATGVGAAASVPAG